MQINDGDPLQFLVKRNKYEDFELVSELEAAMMGAATGQGNRKGKKYVTFGKYAVERSRVVNHQDCPKPLRQVFLKEENDHRKCKSIVKENCFVHIFV